MAIGLEVRPKQPPSGRIDPLQVQPEGPRAVLLQVGLVRELLEALLPQRVRSGL